MKIGVIGAGYVGLTVGPCLAKLGHDVTCVDIDEKKIDSLRAGQIPIYEPGLEELIKKEVSGGRLDFTTNAKATIHDSEILFIAVGTPESEDGSADMKYVFGIAKDIASHMNEYKTVITKSTVPPGTAKQIRQIFFENTNFEFDIVSNPEFLKEGSAISDFLKPDRIVVGVHSSRAKNKMEELYAPLILNGHPIFSMSNLDAELVKYAANCALATKISFINEIANICDVFGANIDNVREGMTSDSRIGKKFYYPGHGYGGSCFPKDVQALIKVAKKQGYSSKLLTAVDNLNDMQKTVLVPKILAYFGSDLSDKTFAVWGLTFKPETDDIREAPSSYLIEDLLLKGANIRTYCPEGMPQAKLKFGDKISYADSKYSAVKNADALILATEWSVFRSPDFEELKSQLKNPVIFDGKNIFKPEKMKDLGFDYFAVGKQYKSDVRKK